MQTPAQPIRLTAETARIRAKAADRIARGLSVYPATGAQRLRARGLAGSYQDAAELLTEVDSD